MNCDDFRAKLDQFLSGELSDQELHTFENHVASCASCTEEAARLESWRNLVKSAAQNRFAPSAQFRERIAHGASHSSSRRFPVWTRMVAAFAVLVVVALLITWENQTQLRRRRLFGEVVGQHSAILATQGTLGIATSDRLTIESWFQGKIPFPLEIPPASDTAFSLVGARLAFFDNKPGAQLIFDSRSHRVSAFVFLASQLQIADLSHDSTAHQKSFNLEFCGKKQLRYLIVGDADPDSIHRLADLMESSEQH